MSDFVTKKPHRKSRGGCQTCKSKRVKCDEAHPKCGFCERRKFTCIYISKSTKSTLSPEVSPDSSSSDSRISLIAAKTPPNNMVSSEDFSEGWGLVQSLQPAVNTSTGTLSKMDMRLLHQWSTKTWDCIAVGSEACSVLLLDVPQMAFENEYLLNCILGISSLHREHLYGSSEQHRQLTAAYRVKALGGFRTAIARTNKHPLDWEAALIMSVLLLALCTKDHTKREGDLTIINWLIFYRGLAAIIQMKSYDDIDLTQLSPIFRRELVELRESPAIPTILISLLEGVTLLDSDYGYLESYCKVLDSLGILYASLKQDGIAPELFIRVVSWPSYTDQPFVGCATEERPRALILLAHYLCFVKLVRGLWWLDDLADKEINMIAKKLGSDWLPFMAVPLKAATMTNREEIAKFILR